MATPNFSLDGDKQLIRNLNNLGKKAKPVVREAVRSASAPIRKSIKQSAPVDDGDLKKSIISKTKTYSSGTSVAIVGPSADYVNTENGKKKVPNKYAHLVEFGTVHSSAKPFMRTGFNRGIQQAMSILKSKLISGIEKAAKK